MINTLIIEDEEPAALRLKKLLTSIDPDIVILGTVDTIESAVKWLKSHPSPDLIMLDIQLGDGLSFNIFRQVEADSHVIFTTAYDEFAIKAFELNSIDYLLKPIDATKLSLSLQKFRKFHTHRQNSDITKLLETLEGRTDKFKKRFVVSIANRIKVVEARDVAFFYSKEKNTFLCTFDGRQYPLEYSLDHLEEMVNPESYFRANRQYLVNFSSIIKIDILSKSRIRIETSPPAGEEIMISSARTADFRIWLDK
jgi:two-component system response regulator LytT